MILAALSLLVHGVYFAVLGHLLAPRANEYLHRGVALGLGLLLGFWGLGWLGALGAVGVLAVALRCIDRADEDLRAYAETLLAILGVLAIFSCIRVGNESSLFQVAHPLQLIWDVSDQNVYLKECLDLLGGEGFDATLKYPLGMHLFLMPWLLLLKEAFPQAGALEWANQVNAVLLPLNLFVALPAVFFGVKKIFRDSQSLRRVAGVGLFVLVLYFLIPPGWMFPRNVLLGGRRLLGLIYGPEILALPLITYLFLDLARPQRSALFSGAVAGLLLLLSERYLAVVGPYLAVLMLEQLRSRAFKWRGTLLGLLGCACLVAPQVGYVLYRFQGDPIGARQQAWQGKERATAWKERQGSLYPDLPADAVITQVSAQYAPQNFKRFWLWFTPMLLLIALFGTLWRSSLDAPQRRLLLMSLGIFSAQFLVSLVYVNPHVLFRYNHPLILVQWLLLLWCFQRWDEKRSLKTA